MGYFGNHNLFVKAYVRDEAYHDVGLALEFYRTGGFKFKLKASNGFNPKLSALKFYARLSFGGLWAWGAGLSL